MGYYTDFIIKVEGEKMSDDIVNAITNISQYEFEWYNDEISTYSKWYNCDDDMRKLSELFPDKLFRVDGQGEDPDDIWRLYWKNGKVQESKRIVLYEPFDENKLR